MCCSPPVNKLLVTVTNYEFSKRADALKQLFLPHYDTVLIDSSSPEPPRSVDFIIPNSYYPGLWNKAVDLAIANNYEWLFFIASDVRTENPAGLRSGIEEAMADYRIGIYTPSLTKDSRLSFPSCFNLGTGGMRGGRRFLLSCKNKDSTAVPPNSAVKPLWLDGGHSVCGSRAFRRKIAGCRRSLPNIPSKEEKAGPRDRSECCRARWSQLSQEPRNRHLGIQGHQRLRQETFHRS